MTKRFFALALVAAIVLLVLAGCGDVSGFTVDYGESALYSKADMNSAIALIKKEFRTWDGCTLMSVEYAGDDVSQGELEYYKGTGDYGDYTECIVFKSEFRTSPFAESNGSLLANEVYSGYNWILLRQDRGSWELIGWGYG